MPVYDRFQDLLRLAHAMRAGWVSLDDIMRETGGSRRTAERLRDALLTAFPGYKEKTDDDRTKAWRIPETDLAPIAAVSAAELEELALAADRLSAEGLDERAALLRDLRTKVVAAMKPRAYQAVEPDLEALMEAEGHLLRAGPRPAIGRDVIQTVRQAILEGRTLRCEYRAREKPDFVSVELAPHGLLYGAEHYLVAFEVGADAPIPKLYRLAAVRDPHVTERTFTRQSGFTLTDYVQGSFGVFQEEPHDVVWRFTPEVRDLVEHYHFHPTQTLSLLEDGSTEVRFRSGGLREMAWHLFQWGREVSVSTPEELNTLYIQLVRDSLSLESCR